MHVDLFFQLIAMFALLFGIGALVYATEVSKRCQLMIDERMIAAETELAEKAHKNDQQLRGALESLRRTAHNLEETELSQTREINILRKVIEPIAKEYEEAQEQKKRPQQRRG